MRYYDIRVTEPSNGKLLYKWTSIIEQGHYKGVANPGALNIEMDIMDSTAGIVDNNSFLRIWGIPLAAQASPNLNLKQVPTREQQIVPIGTTLTDKTISIRAGMVKGLPLANPDQAGLLCTATIWQAFGNWINTDMTLDMILSPYAPSDLNPTNLVLNWRAGTPLAQALAATFSAALPKAKQNIQISSKLVLAYDMIHYTTSMQGLNKLLDPITRQLISDPNYIGVQITYDGLTVTAIDNSAPPVTKPKVLNFQDMIGQATWKDFNLIQAKFVMRGDLKSAYQMTVTMPPGLMTTTAQAYLRFQDKSTFTGNYQIVSLRHVGIFRQASADAWVTIVEMTPEMRPAGDPPTQTPSPVTPSPPY